MGIKIYNTLTSQKEDFIPLEPGRVGFYLCGPTVYDYFHLGNARPFIVFDVYRRFLIYRGFQVKYVMNVTDVDDKIINRAQKEGVSVAEIAARYTQAFFEDMEKLGIHRADVHPKATEHIPEMIKLIQKLLEKGYAYKIGGDVYFQVEKFRKYGRLSGKNLEELKAGARVEVDERKRNPLDFALWKAAKAGEPCWESPWGKGRPGWHIECSAMSMKYLGETFDIHAGGEDLIFPHHENEIAQSCAATSKKFARYWMHNGFLNIQGEKMSKSLGNFLIAREVVKRHRPEVIRLFFLQKHYRSPINYTEEILRQTANALDRLQNTLQNIEYYLKDSPQGTDVAHDQIQQGSEFSRLVQYSKREFIKAMEDDFNSAAAIGKIFEMAKEANRIMEKGELSKVDQFALADFRRMLLEYDQFLGILPGKDGLKKGEGDEDALVALLVQVREELRKKKEWSLADRIRNKLKELGYIIEDRREGSVWYKV
ncbi:cysteine--tRNA ligase [candidate division KSB1 bacterium]|nr:MAG: cysteine--tRNA ligase [candidate division KSB1 bacterium]